MKGQGPMPMVLITLTVTLILVSFIISPMSAAVLEGTKNNARLSSIEISGAINTMKASPSENLVYKMQLPSKCTIDIFEGFVRVSVENARYTADFVRTPVTVSPQSGIDCKQKTITLEKKGNRIEVR